MEAQRDGLLIYSLMKPIALLLNSATELSSYCPFLLVPGSYVAITVEPPITDPPTSGQPLYGHWRTLAAAPIEITTELVFNQPPTSGRFLIPDSGQAACSQLTYSQRCLL